MYFPQHSLSAVVGIIVASDARTRESFVTADNGRRLRRLMSVAISASASNFGVVSERDIKSPTRRRKVVYVRQLFIRLALDNGYSLSAIGRYLSRDHTTIISSRKRFEDDLATDDRVRENYSLAKQHLLRRNLYHS